VAAKSERAKENARAAKREYMRRRRASGWKEPPLTEEQKVKRRAVYRRHHAKYAEKRRAYARQWRKDHPEQVKANKRRSHERIKAQTGRNPQLSSIRKWRHGPGHEVMWTTFWDAQDGKCYLCGDPLSTENYRDIHVDHDHTCCPKGRTCEYCRRGLACTRCNKLIGAAEDDPELLRRIAGNLEPVLKATRARIAAKPQQDGLWDEAS
jgi:Recombination endonuclease VII